MTIFIAWLRAVNVGGTGKLPMAELRTLCQNLGFDRVRTYIQSGNLVFGSNWKAGKVQEALESALHEKMGKPVGVVVCTPEQVANGLDQNPFPDADPRRVLMWFSAQPIPAKALADITIPGREEVAAGPREVFVHYPDGQGRSKLRLPFAKQATARNLNTVRKLLALAREAQAAD